MKLNVFSCFNFSAWVLSGYSVPLDFRGEGVEPCSPSGSWAFTSAASRTGQEHPGSVLGPSLEPVRLSANSRMLKMLLAVLEHSHTQTTGRSSVTHGSTLPPCTRDPDAPSGRLAWRPHGGPAVPPTLWSGTRLQLLNLLNSDDVFIPRILLFCCCILFYCGCVWFSCLWKLKFHLYESIKYQLTFK